MKYTISLFLIITLLGCNKSSRKDSLLVEKIKIPELNLKQANRLAQLPIKCMETEYPNKLGQTIGSAEDLGTPKELHPAFYGCFDWHSAVHGHWSLVSLLKQFPDLEHRDSIMLKLKTNLSKENILKEVEYFQGEHNKTYERTYGWVWLLKLAYELHTWDHPFGKELEANLQPLTDLIATKYIEFLPKLNYPIRVGTHSNTAFGLAFALEYARVVKNTELESAIVDTAQRFFGQDIQCPFNWEPNGYDFLSPCLEEAALMKMVLSKEAYLNWLHLFLPEIFSEDYQLETGKVSDREDGLLVHLDGLNFSRAWCINRIIEDLPELNHLQKIAIDHVNYSLPNLIDDSYEGGHWLASFAICALNSF